MSTRIDHVLLTRFNLPSPGFESTVRSRDGWLEQRVGLFEHYCLPSVAAQTRAGFTWLVYFDPQSPRWLRDRVEDWRHAAPMVPLFRAEVPATDLLRDIAEATRGAGRRILTTNLDNDDALAAEFVARVQDVPVPEEPTAVYLENGLIAAGPRVYRRSDRTNAFCSVSAPWHTPLTCWADWHNRLGLSMPVRIESGAPAWLQVVHGSNVSNRVHGVLASPAEHRASFPELLDVLPEPTVLELIYDAYASRPLRWSRDALRRLGKEVIIRTAGREALDSVRTRMRIDSHPAPVPERGGKP